MARKPWATPEWRKQREEILKDASCSTCGSTKDLCIHHQHIARNKNRMLRSAAFKKLIDSKIKSGEIIPLGRKGKLQYPEQHHELLEKYLPEISDSLKDKLLPENEYTDLISLKDSGEVIVLCSRCHIAGHKHLHLCPECKERYTRYTVCFVCHQKPNLESRALGYARRF